MLTHCFQGLYYLLRHPGFMGWAARRRPGLGWAGVGGCLVGCGLGGSAGRQTLIYRKPSGGNKCCCNRIARPSRHHGSPANVASGMEPPRQPLKTTSTQTRTHTPILILGAELEAAGLMRHQAVAAADLTSLKLFLPAFFSHHQKWPSLPSLGNIRPETRRRGWRKSRARASPSLGTRSHALHVLRRRRSTGGAINTS